MIKMIERYIIEQKTKELDEHLEAYVPLFLMQYNANLEITKKDYKYYYEWKINVKSFNNIISVIKVETNFKENHIFSMYITNQLIQRVLLDAGSLNRFLYREFKGKYYSTIEISTSNISDIMDIMLMCESCLLELGYMV